MAGSDKQKQSLYFPEGMLGEIKVEANRQDRSLSWIVQQAWRIARSEIMRFPSVGDVIGGVRRTGEQDEEPCPSTTRAHLRGGGRRRDLPSTAPVIVLR